MKNLLVIFIIISGLFLLNGCYWDNPAPTPEFDPTAEPQDVSFSGDLLPIFQQNCTNSGCHDEIPTHEPSLVPGQGYSSITQGGFINTAVPTESILFKAVNGGGMPPTGKLTTAEIQKIYDWIRNGAPNN